MSVRVIAAPDVECLLPMDVAIETMAGVFATLARGDAVQPLRSLMWLPDASGLLGLMPACLGAPRSMGIKVVTVMPGNHGTEFDSHQGVVLVFETSNGCLRAVVDATSITAIRTAAVSAFATRLLAREDAGDLALLGSGTQARTHLEAMRAVRPLRRVRVWSRDVTRASAFAARESDRCGIAIEVCGSAREAAAGADLICTVTAAREPVLLGEWIAAGAHVNAVGACFPAARELDTQAVRRARLFVDRRESAVNEAGDILIPIREGAIDERHIVAELGEVATGASAGRTSASDVTLFKSLGLAVEDLAAAHRIWERAEAADAGVKIELGGHRNE